MNDSASLTALFSSSTISAGAGVGVGIGSISFDFTVMVTLPVTPLPSFAVAMISALPTPIALIRPLSFTVTALSFELVHVTSLLSAFSGNTAAAA